MHGNRGVNGDREGIEGKLVNPLDQLFGYQLRRASSLLMGKLSADLDAIGLKVSEASVLVLVGANPGITQSELGRVLGIKRANMVPIAARLERDGLLTRTRVDGRSRGLSLTENGAKAAAGAVRRMRNNDRRFLARMQEAEHGALLSAVHTIWE